MEALRRTDLEFLVDLELETCLMCRSLHDLSAKEGRARIGLEPRVSHSAVTFCNVTVGAMSAHVLNVAVDSLRETPIG